MHSISQNLELRRIGAAVAAASNTDNNSDRIDMTDYQAARFFVTITDSAATGVATLKVEGNDTDSDSGMTLITSASHAKTCAINDDLNDKVLMVEVRNPSYRYIQGVRTSATANIAFGEIYVELIPRRVPVTQHSSIHTSPAYVQD